MINACITYLEQKIKAVMGQNTPFFDRLADLQACAEQHVASAIVEKDVLAYSGASSRNLDTKLDDTLLFSRSVTLLTTMGEYKLETLSPLFEQFLASLDQGFRHEGHYIGIELGEANWIDRKDSLIKASIAVETPITFKGGVYRAARFAQINNITIERAETNGG